MKTLRLLKCLVFFVCVAVVPVNAQDTIQEIASDPYYEVAYKEIADMLDGKTSLSIKRAVFLTEWAYLGGELDYDEFCIGIDTVVNYLQKFIAINDLGKYKTGGNFALFEYFSRPYSGNGYKPFTYDYDDFGGTEDYTKTFVSKVMRTHLGQCRSLPFYYKILAEAIGAEAHITLAPQHYFIRHPDEVNPNKWVNVELTGSSLSREIWLIESFNISDVAIRNKVYMYPLSDEETVALLLSELPIGYLRKYRNYDNLVWSCAVKSLEYYPQNITALMLKANYINLELMFHLSDNGNAMDDYARMLDKQWYDIRNTIEALGWAKMDDATYERLLKGTAEAMREKGIDEQTISFEMERNANSK